MCFAVRQRLRQQEQLGHRLLRLARQAGPRQGVPPLDDDRRAHARGHRLMLPAHLGLSAKGGPRPQSSCLSRAAAPG
eukprot:2680023-Pleurochrysis_carterae.AAC.1